jgi:REP element-mobilizing transposase RayT
VGYFTRAYARYLDVTARRYRLFRRWRDIKKLLPANWEGARVWQPRFWEHAIRNEDDYRRHMDYVYINPVKHGYVRG